MLRSNLTDNRPMWNTPKLQATIHFLSLLPSDVAAKIGRENAMRIYKLPPR